MTWKKQVEEGGGHELRWALELEVEGQRKKGDKVTWKKQVEEGGGHELRWALELEVEGQRKKGG